MIVVDTNVIAYLMINGEFTDRAKKVFMKDPEWVAPVLWKYEFLNILATLVNTGRADLNDVIKHYEKTIKILSRIEKEPNYDNVLSLTKHHKISAYDAQFVSLAMEINIPLITQDNQLLENFPDLAKSMHQFIS